MPAYKRGGECALPITIGANVWIAAGVVIDPGVTIGDDTVVGAGTVLLHDLPAGVVAAGNPLRIVRRLRRRPPPDHNSCPEG